MYIIIGTDSYGDNFFKFLQYNNYEIIQNPDYKFLSIKNENEISHISFSKNDFVIIVSNISEDASSNLTLKTTRYFIDKVKVKNIIIMPFIFESGIKLTNETLEQLITINQNLRLVLNDNISKNVSVQEAMHSIDEQTANIVINDNKIIWKNFVLKYTYEKKTYKSLVTFWSKDFIITLFESEYKILDKTHMALNIPSRFTFKDDNTNISSIQDIEEITYNIFKNYIEKEN